MLIGYIESKCSLCIEQLTMVLGSDALIWFAAPLWNFLYMICTFSILSDNSKLLNGTKSRDAVFITPVSVLISKNFIISSDFCIKSAE